MVNNNSHRCIVTIYAGNLHGQCNKCKKYYNIKENKISHMVKFRWKHPPIYEIKENK